MNKEYLHGLSEEEFDKLFFAEDEIPKQAVHEDNADTLVTPNLVNKHPGMLKTQGSLVIHTRSAHRLFYGRRRDDEKGIRPIVGLVRFALNMNQICLLAAADDPYADAVLLEVENKLEACNKTIGDYVAELEALIADIDGISIDVYDSVEPVTVPLEFKTTYGFLGARLVSQYDKLIRLAQSAKHVGLFFKEDWSRIVGNTGRMIRHVFQLSSNYRFTGVKRDDIAANTAVAQSAIEKYGELPQVILEGETRAKYAPAITRPQDKP